MSRPPFVPGICFLYLCSPCSLRASLNRQTYSLNRQMAAAHVSFVPSMPMPADLLDGGLWRRETWERRTTAERLELWPHASKAMGIDCPKLELATFYYPTLGISIRGVRATENIRSAELVCRVPKLSLLSAFTIQNSSLSPLINEVGLRSAMAVFLIRESARRESFWMPYVKALLEAHPTDGIPQMWDPVTSQERLNSLSNYSRSLAASSRASTEAEWRRLAAVGFRRHAAALSEGGVCGAGVCTHEQLMRETFSLERFRNLVSVLGARQWSLPWYSPGTHILFSAPGADLLNHGSPGDVKNRFRANEHAFTMHAKRLLRKGEEVRKFYSPTCCERYLNAFGFAPVGVAQCPSHVPQGPNPCYWRERRVI